MDNVKIYSGCECVEDMTGWDNDQAKDGPCNSMKCQAGWMIFEVNKFLHSNFLFYSVYILHYFVNSQQNIEINLYLVLQ